MWHICNKLDIVSDTENSIQSINYSNIFETSLNILQRFKGAFTCNRDEISSRDETGPGMKKFLFTSEFHPGMKRVEFHPGMKCGLKENLTLSMKKYSRIYHFSLIC